MIQLTIEAKIVPDSDICNCRKEESIIPQIPSWCSKSLGGRTYGPHVSNIQPEIPHKKRWFAHNLYYKSYHVEYQIWEHRRQYRSAFNDCQPDSEYMDWMIKFIVPKPGELIYLKYRGCRLIPNSPQIENMEMKHYTYKVENFNGKLVASLIAHSTSPY